MLFHEVDMTEVLRVRSERDQRLERIDTGVAAVKAAVDKIRKAGVTITESSVIPDAEIRAAALDADGVKWGATLLETLGQVERLRGEVAEAEALVQTRAREIEAAEKLRKLEFRKEMKNGLRFLTLFLVILLLRACLAAMK